MIAHLLQQGILTSPSGGEALLPLRGGMAGMAARWRRYGVPVPGGEAMAAALQPKGAAGNWAAVL